MLEVYVSLIAEVVVHQYVLRPVRFILEFIIQAGMLHQQLIR